MVKNLGLRGDPAVVTGCTRIVPIGQKKYKVICNLRGDEPVPDAELVKKALAETLRVWGHAAFLASRGVLRVEDVGGVPADYSQRTVGIDDLFPDGVPQFSKSLITMFADVVVENRVTTDMDEYPPGCPMPTQRVSLTVTERTTLESALAYLRMQVGFMDANDVFTQTWKPGEEVAAEEPGPVDEAVGQDQPTNEPPAQPRGSRPTVIDRKGWVIGKQPPKVEGITQVKTVIPHVQLGRGQFATLCVKGLKLTSEEKEGRGGGSFTAYRAEWLIHPRNNFMMFRNKDIKAVFDDYSGDELSMENDDGKPQLLSEPIYFVVTLSMDGADIQKNDRGFAYLEFVAVQPTPDLPTD